jgi:hypothetical protein
MMRRLLVLVASVLVVASLGEPAVAGGPAPAPPDPPTALVAHLGCGDDLTLEWAPPLVDSDPPIGGYIIYADGVSIAEVGLSPLTYGPLPIGPEYSIASANVAATSEPAIFVNTTIPACVGQPAPVLSGTGCGQLPLLTWSAPAGEVTGYRVYRDGSAVADLDADQLRYTVVEPAVAPSGFATDGEPHTWQVSALNNSEEGVLSNEVVLPPCPPVAAPLPRQPQFTG